LTAYVTLKNLANIYSFDEGYFIHSGWV
jgi:hypothetical protein